MRSSRPRASFHIHLGVQHNCTLGTGTVKVGGTRGCFAVVEDACKLTASFARMTAAFASRSSSRMWGALVEDRSVTFDINASILAIRFRTLFAFMTTSSQLRLVNRSNE